MPWEAEQPQIEPVCNNADADLLSRVRHGDRATFSCLVQRWEESLLRIAYRIIGFHDEAEEIRQIVLLRILESPQRLPEPRCFAAWIRRCVINEAASRASESSVHDRATVI
jgi:DNA-directed RNA polymerase specialized sigma24 family protein